MMPMTMTNEQKTRTFFFTTLFWLWLTSLTATLARTPPQFSFFMLKALWEMADVLPFPVEKIVYVMTDFTESNFNFWKTHPVLHEVRMSDSWSIPRKKKG